MAKKGGPSITGMHIAFGIGSALLLLCTLYVVVQDHYGRDFPKYQDKYDAAELKRLKAADEAAGKQLQADDLKQALANSEKELSKAQSETNAKQGEVDKAKAEIKKIDDELQLATRQLNFMKADRDAIKYQVDAKKRPLSDLDDQNKKVDVQFVNWSGLKTRKDAALEQIAEIESSLKKARRDLESVENIKKDVDVKIKKAVGDPLINLIKDAPGLDVVAPRRHINQVLLNNLPESVFFANHMRVDRCVTCHQGIENPDPMYTEKDSKKLDVVLRSHPRLDLFVSPNSKHPYNKFGCTICHQGSPLATEFSRAAHMPQNEKQAEDWEKTYKWEPMEFWDDKMLPLQHTEASCLKCHKGVDDIPEAAKLNEGRHLFRERGCTNCHMGASGDKDMAWVGRVGPDLRRIGEKTDIHWARQWIENPWDFRPTTKMPRFFGLENRLNADGSPLALNLAGGAHVPRDPVEVEAIATYLFTVSKLREKPAPKPEDGNSENGAKLFAILGCLGCHSTHDAAGENKFEFNQHGPDLSRIGDKVTPGWLFTWIKNPRHYWPETKMPNLRLTDEEAKDITSYLMKTMVKAKIAPKPQSDEAAFDAIIIDKLGNTMPKETIEKLLKDTDGLFTASRQKKEMVGLNSLMAKVKSVANPEGKLVDSKDGEWNEEQIAFIKETLSQEPNKSRAVKAFYTGEMLIQNYGCYGCHNIQGWTYSPLTCVNLAGEADKDIEKFDFGKTQLDKSIPHTKWDWFYTKIARPRVYDIGKLELIAPFDRLRMPWFGYQKPEKSEAHGLLHPDKNKDESTPNGLKEEEIQRLVTHLLSLTAQVIPAEMQHQPSPQEIAWDRGHRVIRELNCTGCHLVSLDKGTEASPSTLPMDSLIALITPEGKAFTAIPGNGVYLDEDIVSIRYEQKDKGEGNGEISTLDDFINIKRGTYLTGTTVPILLEEKTVIASALEAPVRVNFKLDKKARGANWVTFEELVPEEQYVAQTRLFYADEAAARKAYGRIKGQFGDKEAYEKMVGTAVLQQRNLLTTTEVEMRKANRRFFQPVAVKVRFTRGEGRIVDHIIKLEGKRGVQTPTQQQGPPSLSFEGGKVQPDWLYQFLHNVYPLRAGLNIRMPSFWTDGPYSKYKTIYPAGHLSAVNPAKRDKGIGGEPIPGPDTVKYTDMPDDAAEVVDFFIRDGGQKNYGYQPLPIANDDRKLYQEGQRLVFSAETEGGMGCTNCHAFGKKEPSEPKWAPNLINVKRRLKSDWVRRFLTNPASIYPWANMPNNFDFDWTPYNHNFEDGLRGISDGNEAKVKTNVDKLKAIHYYLMHSGDAEIGAGDTKPAAEAKPAEK